MLELADRWVWDFWHVRDHDVHHLFFLAAPRALGDPDLRHWHAAVGHATSTDLRGWTVRPDVFGPGEPGSFDDRTTWTGSIVRDGDTWVLGYTGTSHAEDGLVQRIGIARSPDLVTWTRPATRPSTATSGTTRRGATRGCTGRTAAGTVC